MTSDDSREGIVVQLDGKRTEEEANIVRERGKYHWLKRVRDILFGVSYVAMFGIGMYQASVIGQQTREAAALQRKNVQLEAELKQARERSSELERYVEKLVIPRVVPEATYPIFTKSDREEISSLFELKITQREAISRAMDNACYAHSVDTTMGEADAYTIQIANCTRVSTNFAIALYSSVAEYATAHNSQTRNVEQFIVGPSGEKWEFNVAIGSPRYDIALLKVYGGSEVEPIPIGTFDHDNAEEGDLVSFVTPKDSGARDIRELPESIGYKISSARFNGHYAGTDLGLPYVAPCVVARDVNEYDTAEGSPMVVDGQIKGIVTHQVVIRGFKGERVPENGLTCTAYQLKEIIEPHLVYHWEEQSPSQTPSTLNQ